jgi:hypothetical protein
MHGNRLNADLMYNQRAADQYIRLLAHFPADAEYMAWLQSKIERYTRRARILEAARKLKPAQRLRYIQDAGYFQ